jgi:hypothetical protein
MHVSRDWFVLIQHRLESESQLVRTQQNAMARLIHQDIGQHGPAVTDGIHLEVVVLAKST